MGSIRRKLLVANWKMNMNVSSASLYLHRLQERIMIHRDVEVVLSPPMLSLQPLSLQIDRRKFRLAAQNAYHIDEGAYTGEVSFAMINNLVHYAIIGHSERRHVFGETNDIIRSKVAAAARNEIWPIVCVGETLNEKLEGHSPMVIHDQVVAAISDLTRNSAEGMVFAYEPVWAISDGKNYGHHQMPEANEIAKAVAKIRQTIASHFGNALSQRVRVLYGGSTNSDNAKQILDIEGVDGLLIGGASLNYHEFAHMVDLAVVKAGKEK